MSKEITYDELIEKIPNKYILTLVAGERLRNLMQSEKKNEHILVSKTLKEIVEENIEYEVE